MAVSREIARFSMLLRDCRVTNNIRKEKLTRIQSGNTPRCLDLFSGCGGLSLGFHTAGFKIVGAVEIDPVAAKSHALNFHSGDTDSLYKAHASARDITKLEPEEVVEELNLGSNIEDVVDVIVGGPPCQSFARVGRAKLREVMAHPEAFRQDPRSNLYLRYLHYVKKLQPLVVLMENVPDVLNHGGHNIPQEMCEVLTDMGYVCRYTLLNAAYYGVPQMRERMFLIAYGKDIAENVEFPTPTHWIALPKGYQGSRQVALKSLTASLFNRDSFYVDPPEASPELPPAITAREALGDLPPITLHLEGQLKRGARRFNKMISYRDDVNPSPYANLMRNWPGFENKEGISDHVIRYLPRDYDIFRRMNPGDQYPQAYQHAMNLLTEEIKRLASNGTPVKDDAVYLELKKRIVPPYDANKFPNKWRKMEADYPARTLMAHLGKDSYSHIHYDSSQARTISVREAARLQSFPDGFLFEGTMNPAFRQIGNAVPPLLAYSLACVMLDAVGVRHTSTLFEELYEPV